MINRVSAGLLRTVSICTKWGGRTASEIEALQSKRLAGDTKLAGNVRVIPK